MNAIGLRAALIVVRCAVGMLPDPHQRARYLEEWQADVHGAADIGMSPLLLALGAAGAAARIGITATKGSIRMVPLGPLAIAMKIVGGSRMRQRAAALAIFFTLALLVGVGVLVRR